MVKEMFYKIEFVIDNYYWGDGVIELRDNEFEGYIASDYISGVYQDGALALTLIEYDYFEDAAYISNFYGVVSDFELPGTFYVVCSGDDDFDDAYAKLEFCQKVSISKKYFENTLNDILKSFYL